MFRPGYETIRALRPGGQEQMGNRVDFSENDVVKIQKLYSCDIGGTRITTPDPVTPTRNCQDEANAPWCVAKASFCMRSCGNFCDAVRQYCKMTCGRCGTTGPRPTPQPRPEPSNCENQATDAWCNDRAGRGYCAHNQQVIDSCPNSCNWCGKAKPTAGEKPCENSARNEWCDVHAATPALCRDNVVKRSCKLKCGLCDTL